MMAETVREIFGLTVWLSSVGIVLLAGLYVLYKVLKFLLPAGKGEKFSLSKELKEFRKRKRRFSEPSKLSKEELARTHILAAVNSADIETVERIVMELKREIERRKEEEDEWRDEWSKDRRDKDNDFIVWYTTINVWNKD